MQSGRYLRPWFSISIKIHFIANYILLNISEKIIIKKLKKRAVANDLLISNLSSKYFFILVYVKTSNSSDNSFTSFK